jgi:hypothetical protein
MQSFTECYSAGLISRRQQRAPARSIRICWRHLVPLRDGSSNTSLHCTNKSRNAMYHPCTTDSVGARYQRVFFNIERDTKF